MGDRAHAKVIQRDGVVYLYSHWTGYRIKDDIRDGLIVGHDRWDDEDYLTRIIFDAIRVGAGGDHYPVTGLGIGTSVPDGWQVVIDIPAKTVNGIPFSEYIKT